jgi:hypothetical protein
MGRYSRQLTLPISADRLSQKLAKTLEYFNLRVLHASEDYIIASENPGSVPFPQLVTVEVLVDTNRTSEREVSLNLVVKNQELPLRSDNYCNQMFEQISEALVKSRSGELIP